MSKLDDVIGVLLKLYENIKKNPNRDFSLSYIDDKKNKLINLKEEFNELYLKYTTLNSTHDKLVILNEKRNKFIDLTNLFNNILVEKEKLARKANNFEIIKTEMALDSFKVLDAVTKLFPQDFDGNPLKLEQTIKILNAVKTTITHADNQQQVISLLQLKLIGKAAEALPTTINSIDDIIKCLKDKCRGQSSRQIATSLEGTVCTDRKRYIKDIQEMSEKLRTAYINEGVQKETAITYVIDDISKNIKRNFNTNTVMVAAMNQSFTSVDEVLHRFENIQIDKEASVLAYRQFMNKNGNSRGRNNHQSYNNGGNNGGNTNNKNKNNYNKHRGFNKRRGNYNQNKHYNPSNKKDYDVKHVDGVVPKNSSNPHQQQMGEDQYE